MLSDLFLDEPAPRLLVRGKGSPERSMLIDGGPFAIRRSDALG